MAAGWPYNESERAGERERLRLRPLSTSLIGVTLPLVGGSTSTPISSAIGCRDSFECEWP